MKRTALRRKTPLKRKPMRRGKRKNKYARRERDMAYMGWVRNRVCSMMQMGAWLMMRGEPEGERLLALWQGPLDFDGCRGQIEAHHAGDRAYGHKSEDAATIPMCERHHRGDDIGITRRRGPFAGWPRGAVHQWELAMIELHQARYAAHVAGMQEVCA